jgi:hypothetical protein
MRNPFYHTDSISASGTVRTGSITLGKTRTLSVTTRLLFGGSIDADATVYAYYSPDGNNWDTIAFTSWSITYTASGTIQRTILLDVPEHGHIEFKIENGSSADTIDDVYLWHSIQAWEEK